MEDKEFLDQISDRVEEANKKAREYEVAKNRGNFNLECPYPEIIGLYEYVKELFLERGWNNEVSKCTLQIESFQEKLEKDKKLREIEAQKAEKEKYFKELHKIQEVDTMELVLQSLDKEEELLNFEEKKKREKEESDEIFNIISNAQKLEKEYDLEKKRRRILQSVCPYEKIIEIYNEAIKRFKIIGWNKEIPYLVDSINHYNELIEKDKILRELAKKK
jgi:hypothetical protein